ncbi:MAG: hydantoinase/oxoprolinase family protein, partial [Proteobacteria bacterium]|nr:hydantoinase/oxoprolinase family protein [Pseudomonadota bacterium]
MNFRISVDTGGTFTDVVVCDDSGRSAIGKALTVPESAFEGTFNAIGSAAGEWNLSAEALLAATQLLIYGTTRATNAIVTGSAAKTAMLVTAGFADVLLIREGGKSNPHDFSMDFPRPYVPRRHTFEIRERVGADGEVITPLCEESAAQRIDDLRKSRFEAVAVCLLWSIANATHELQIGRMLSTMMPGVPFTLSHQLLPVMREYRRASATAIDASLKPLMQAHLK